SSGVRVERWGSDADVAGDPSGFWNGTQMLVWARATTGHLVHWWYDAAGLHREDWAGDIADPDAGDPGTGDPGGGTPPPSSSRLAGGCAAARPDGASFALLAAAAFLVRRRREATPARRA